MSNIVTYLKKKEIYNSTFCILHSVINTEKKIFQINGNGIKFYKNYQIVTFQILQMRVVILCLDLTKKKTNLTKKKKKSCV